MQLDVHVLLVGQAFVQLHVHVAYEDLDVLGVQLGIQVHGGQIRVAKRLDHIPQVDQVHWRVAQKCKKLNRNKNKMKSKC